MQKKALYIIWGFLYILCAGLGFIPNPQGFLSALMTGLSVAFFIPGGCLLWLAVREQDAKGIAAIRNLAAVSLGATVAVLMLNFLSISASQTAGDILYGLLILVSSPMVCSQVWVLSLFLWSCLLMAAVTQGKKRK